MKFRSERDSLIEMLATAGRAVGARATSSPVLSGLLLSCTGQRALGDRNRPRSDHSGHPGGDRGGGRNMCRSGPPLHRHRAPAGARRGDLRQRRRPHHHFGGPIELQVTHLSGGGVPGGRTDDRGDHPASRAGPERSCPPGGAGGLARRCPPPPHGGPAFSGGRLHPHGGHRLLPHGPARPARDQRPAR